jgi:hypothetical protein
VPPGDYRYLVVTDVRHESAEGGRLDNNAAASTATVSFAMPPPMGKITRDSRFGMNGVGLVELAKRQGNGWNRFENLKWPFAAPRGRESVRGFRLPAARATTRPEVGFVPAGSCFSCCIPLNLCYTSR